MFWFVIALKFCRDLSVWQNQQSPRSPELNMPLITSQNTALEYKAADTIISINITDI